MKRCTLKTPLVLEGKGIHSGEKNRMQLKPAPLGLGIVFYHEDASLGSIQAHPSSVVDTRYAITLGNGKWKVQLIEHFMAALHALGITDISITLSSSELPIMDGSSLPFYEAMLESRAEKSDQEMSSYRLNKAVWLVQGTSYILAVPQDYLSITYSICYPHPMIQHQSLSLDINEDTMRREILPARTFGFSKDLEAMRSQGLARGISLDNVLSFSEDGCMNESFRFENECVRHKILDIIGDMYLLGCPLHAHITAYKASHNLHINLLHQIMNNSEKMEIEESSLEKEDSSIFAA